MAPLQSQKSASLSYVKETVASSPVVVFSKTQCPYCEKAKNALESVIGNRNFTIIEVDETGDQESIKDALEDLTGVRTVPRVFVGGKFIGGGDDTTRKASCGLLRELLNNAGVETTGPAYGRMDSGRRMSESGNGRRISECGSGRRISESGRRISGTNSGCLMSDGASGMGVH